MHNSCVFGEFWSSAASVCHSSGVTSQLIIFGYLVAKGWQLGWRRTPHNNVAPCHAAQVGSQSTNQPAVVNVTHSSPWRRIRLGKRRLVTSLKYLMGIFIYHSEVSTIESYRSTSRTLPLGSWKSSLANDKLINPATFPATRTTVEFNVSIRAVVKGLTVKHISRSGSLVKKLMIPGTNQAVPLTNRSTGGRDMQSSSFFWALDVLYKAT